MPATPVEKPVIAFRTQKVFATWLKKNHAKHQGILMHLFKKASGEKTISYAEAVEVALCYGWTAGQAFYDTLSKASKYAIGYGLMTAAKPETREKRFKKIIAMLREGKAPHLL